MPDPNCCCYRRSRFRCRSRADPPSMSYRPLETGRLWETRWALIAQCRMAIHLYQLSRNRAMWLRPRWLNGVCVDFQHDSIDLKISVWKRREKKKSLRLVMKAWQLISSSSSSSLTTATNVTRSCQMFLRARQKVLSFLFSFPLSASAKAPSKLCIWSEQTISDTKK